MAGIFDIEHDQGSTFEKSFQVLDAFGTPFDLSAYTMSAQIRASFTGSLVAQFAVQVTNGVNGEFKLVLAATASAGMDAKQKFVYDVERSLAAEVKRVIQGSFVITPEATK